MKYEFEVLKSKTLYTMSEFGGLRGEKEEKTKKKTTKKNTDKEKVKKKQEAKKIINN